MFQLQITVHSIEEAERILACLKHSADPAAVQRVQDQIPTSGDGTKDGEPAVDKPKNPRGRPRRQVADPLPESAAPATPENAVAEAPNAGSAEANANPAQQTPTLDDVRGALMDVQNKTPGDMTACLAILEKFGAKRVSEVKEADFAKFIAACKAV